MASVRQAFALLRPKHWVKNLLVVLPAFFSGRIFESDTWPFIVAAFLAFSFVASAVYAINDVRDAPADRLHPTKKNRPVASGAVPVSVALALAGVLAVAAFVITALFAYKTLLSLCLLAAYVVINIAYSLGLKNIPIIDVAILSAGFLLRVLFGGAFLSIEVSSWLFLTVLSLTLYIALGKRREEIRRTDGSARKSLRGYTAEFLDKNMAVFLGCALVFYSLWAYEQSVASVMYLVSVPVAMLACLEYSLAIERSDSDGDPVNVALSDKLLIVLALVWVAVIAWALCL